MLASNLRPTCPLFRTPPRLIEIPSPIENFRQIDPMATDVIFVVKEPIADELLEISGLRSQTRYAVHDVAGEVKAVNLIEDHHVEGCRRGSLLLISPNMEIGMIRPAIRQAMDQPGITVVGKNDRFILGEEDIKLFVAQSVRMLASRLERHQIDDINNPDLQIRKFMPEHFHRRQGLKGGHIARAGHDHVWISSRVIAGPFPDPEPGGTVFNGRGHLQPLQLRLFARDNDIYVMPAPQTVVDHRQERIRIGGKIDADDVRLLIDDRIDEPGILVTESVMVLAPNVRGE